jgi:hypothetical protein
VLLVGVNLQAESSPGFLDHFSAVILRDFEDLERIFLVFVKPKGESHQLEPAARCKLPVRHEAAARGVSKPVDGGGVSK